MKIWKYQLVPGVNHIDMPAGAKILSAHSQSGGDVAIWALCNPQMPTHVRCIMVVRTAEELATNFDVIGAFVATVLLGDSFPVHVFDLGGAPHG